MAYKITNGNGKQNPKSNTTHQNVKKSYISEYKGASFIDAKIFHEVLNKMEIDGYICETGRGENASFFVKSHLIDNNKNIVSNAFSTENNDVSLLQQENISLPVTVNSPEAFTNRTYNNLETNTPKLRHLQRPDVILFLNN